MLRYRSEARLHITAAGHDHRGQPVSAPDTGGATQTAHHRVHRLDEVRLVERLGQHTTGAARVRQRPQQHIRGPTPRRPALVAGLVAGPPLGGELVDSGGDYDVVRRAVSPALVAHELVVRTDSAGASHWFAEECRDRNIGFSLGYWIDGRVRDALLLVQEEDWQPAREADARVRDGAQVVEITHLLNLKGWPPATRAIVRRERPHPGAQLSLFDSIEGLRHTAFITDTESDDLAALDLRHRQRGRAEQIIRDTKACGLARLPFDGAANNDRWMQLTFCANDLLCWARRISCTGPLRRATPKTIRHRLLHIAAHASPRRLRLDSTWLWTSDLFDALERLKARLRPPPPSVPIRPAIYPGL
jgi:hypothetical protein